MTNEEYNRQLSWWVVSSQDWPVDDQMAKRLSKPMTRANVISQPVMYEIRLVGSSLVQRVVDLEAELQVARELIAELSRRPLPEPAASREAFHSNALRHTP